MKKRATESSGAEETNREAVVGFATYVRMYVLVRFL